MESSNDRGVVNQQQPHWDQASGWQPNPPLPQKRSPNPLFTVLAFLSALPTVFFLMAFVAGDGTNVISLGVFLWCAMWTWVWVAMARRYR
ncbi:hypothetical protein 40AC_40 [Mycobacterium phage 40AC]|uniref:Uncharacterized protein n=1 Tax=Mycobacterium phage 40AC TaxID=1458717 RepID=W8E8Z7_9CAUD|nr:hypothetical protein ST40AC_40 [Mycobacterium phage 40AC]AHJ86404.1 hypothetical protein 40AC_40 [Mycobacterium phage 40AC]